MGIVAVEMLNQDRIFVLNTAQKKLMTTVIDIRVRVKQLQNRRVYSVVTKRNREVHFVEPTTNN